MKNFINLLSIFCLAFCVSNCTPETIKPLPVDPYTTGVFVLNEGPFGSGTGTVTHYDPTSKTAKQDIYGTANNAGLLGNVVQSMSVYKDKGYVVVNNANTIQVVNANTFASISKITGLAFPRYFMPLNDKKAYITQWGKDGLTGSIAVYDIANNLITKTIALGSGHERMLISGTKLYVTLSGGYGNDNRVLIIDTNTDAITSNIKVSDCPVGIVQDAKGAIWVLCRGYYDFAKNTFTDGGLVKIVNDKVEGTPTKLSQGADELVMDNTKTKLYFMADGELRKADISSGAAIITPLKSKYYYGLGIDPKTNSIYAADAGDFKSNGTVDILNESGAIQSSFAAGIGVADFWFK